MKTVYRFLRPHMRWVILCLTVKVLASFSELMIPRVLAVIVDDAVPSGEMSAVLRAGGTMLFFALLTLLFNLFGNLIAARVSARFSQSMRDALMRSAMYLDTAATDRFAISSLTSRLTSDTYNLTSFLARLQRVGIKGPLMLIGGIVITLTIDWRLALVLIAVLPLVCFTVYRITVKAVPVYTEEQDILDSLVRRVDETASGIRVIKALSRTEYEQTRFHRVSRDLADKERKAGRLMGLTKPMTDLILNIGFCLVILLGALLSRYTGFHATGKLLAFMTYFTIILNNMIMMTRIFVQASRSIASAHRIEEVLLTESELPLLPEESEMHDERERDGYLVFDDVSFSYNKRKPDLSHISFSLGRGQTLGIIGATGSGKSTILNLLLRFYDPDAGEIRIGGRDIRTYPQEELHRMFGVAFQNDFVPAGTVEENVAFFRPHTDTDVTDALATAQASDFVSAYPDGIGHEITSRGSNLSGGQRQRITVARAVMGAPDILVLDDAASALDYRTDRELRRAIRQNTHATVILISQRISTVRAADDILVLDGGRIIGHGTHESLLADCPAYRGIAEVQMGGVGA